LRGHGIGERYQQDMLTLASQFFVCQPVLKLQKEFNK
jgi:hypothetical protein